MCKRAYKTASLLLALLFVVAVAVPASAAPPYDSCVWEVAISPVGSNGAIYTDKTVTYDTSGYRNGEQVDLKLPAEWMSNSLYTRFYIVYTVDTGSATEFWTQTSDAGGNAVNGLHIPPDWGVTMRIAYQPTKEMVLQDNARYSFQFIRVVQDGGSSRSYVGTRCLLHFTA